jgi:putative transposase
MTLCVEDLQVKNIMKNNKLVKSITNVGWGM